ncbi:MAG TPA: hypothetical protein VFX03_11860, partial [Thermomicrobiales bacterium]|nr:hypothetical protein [Thermomicrobiales bacterium]
RLVDAGDGAASLLSRLATAIAGRPVDFGAATATGFGLGHDLLWGTVELDVSLPDMDNGWWMLTDDERAELLVRLRGALDWVAVGADAVVQPNVVTALDLPNDLRAVAGQTWQQRLRAAPVDDRDETLARLGRELAGIARERDAALDEWRRRMLDRLRSELASADPG